MAFVDIPPVALCALDYSAVNTTIGVQGFTLNTSGHKYAMIVQAPSTGTITALNIYFDTISVAGDVDVRIETIDDTVTPAVPTGVLFGANTDQVITISGAGWATVTLTAGASVTQGQYFAVVISQTSATGNRRVVDANSLGVFHQYIVTYNGSVWAVRNASTAQIFLSYGGTYYPLPQSVGLQATLSFHTGTTPDEVGNLWTPTATVKVAGVKIFRTGAADHDVIIYDSANNIVVSRTLDHNVRFGTNAGTGNFMFNSTATLSQGQQYRIVIKPLSGTTINVSTFTAPSSAAMTQMPGRGQYQRTQRTDAGAWSETSTQEIFLYPIVNAIDLPSGGIAKLVGGGLVS